MGLLGWLMGLLGRVISLLGKVVSLLGKVVSLLAKVLRLLVKAIRFLASDTVLIIGGSTEIVATAPMKLPKTALWMRGLHSMGTFFQKGYMCYVGVVMMADRRVSWGRSEAEPPFCIL